MTYASGGLIQATDFNTRATAVNAIWGTGANANGYGQASTVTTTSTGTVVPATDWATLIARISSMNQHQVNNTTGVPTQPTSGSIITYLNTLDTAISTVNTNKLSSFAQQAAIAFTAAQTASNTNNWQVSAQRTFTATFANGNAARHFFNANGYLELSFVNTSLSGNVKSTTWNTFLTTGVKQHILRANASYYTGTGFTPNTNLTSQGYYNLTRGLTTFFQVYDTPSSVDYVNNYMLIQYGIGSAQNAGGNGDNGTTVVVNVSMVDAAGDVFNDNVSGNLCVQLRPVYPELTYLTSESWGAVTIAANVNTQT
ncbi:hypothetical protein EB001_00670 [bacterium]|nr:hypothetical protein [bacterium]